MVIVYGVRDDVEIDLDRIKGRVVGIHVRRTSCTCMAFIRNNEYEFRVCYLGGQFCFGKRGFWRPPVSEHRQCWCIEAEIAGS